MKTLKDVEPNELEDYVDKRDFYDAQRLRDVAKEWITELGKEYTKICVKYDCIGKIKQELPREYHEIRGKIEWIKHFFNLEDE